MMTMEQSVESVMRHCRRAFEYDCYCGNISISGGAIAPSPDCDWVWISGSLKNDGLHKLNEVETSLLDENFNGKVWRLSPPSDFLALCEQIHQYIETVDPTKPLSETFGSYSYTRAKNADGTPQTWQHAFSGSLGTFACKQMIPGVFW